MRTFQPGTSAVCTVRRLARDERVGKPESFAVGAQVACHLVEGRRLPRTLNHESSPIGCLATSAAALPTPAPAAPTSRPDTSVGTASVESSGR